MAIYQEETTCSIFLDELYCEEESWEENDESSLILPMTPSSVTSASLCYKYEEECVSWEDQEVENLFKKEKQGNIILNEDVSMINARKENVEWMLKVKSNYGFCGLTLILSVNYFDRFISSINNKQVIQPWTIQLAAVTCLSLAAKVEETSVPFLLDLQVEGERPIYEARDVEKMELLVLSTLDWKMHPITPISFLHHITRRLGLTNHLHWQFLAKCEHVLLSLLSDWRFVGYLPSVLAAATMMHVIDNVHISNPSLYQTHLLNLLNLTKEKVNDCYEKIVEKSSSIHNFKRKLEDMNNNDNNDNDNDNDIIPSSRSEVIDAYGFSSDSSNDSWAASTTTSNPINNNTLSASSSVSSPVPSSPVIPRKKGRVHEQSTSISRDYVDFVANPRRV